MEQTYAAVAEKTSTVRDCGNEPTAEANRPVHMVIINSLKDILWTRYSAMTGPVKIMTTKKVVRTRVTATTRGVAKRTT